MNNSHLSDHLLTSTKFIRGFKPPLGRATVVQATHFRKCLRGGTLNLRQRLAVLAIAGTMTAGMVALTGTAASAAPAAPSRSAGVVSGSTRLTPEAAKLATGT